MEDIPTPIKTKVLHIWDQPISKIYTDFFGCSLIRSRSGNEDIMIAYHYDSNTILQAPFANRKIKHRIRSYNSIMMRLAEQGHQVDVKILDNEVSADFNRTRESTYQLVPPNVHQRNISVRAICTFKAHFLSVWYGVDPDFTNLIWEKRLVQTDLTLKLLCQATPNPSILAWEYFKYWISERNMVICHQRNHNNPPNKHRTIKYGAKLKILQPKDTSPSLD